MHWCKNQDMQSCITPFHLDKYHVSIYALAVRYNSQNNSSQEEALLAIHIHVH